MIRGRSPLLALALGALLSSALPSCYDEPRPQCGFRCGPDGACPEGYTCSSADGRCHLDGSPASLVCGGDAGIGPDGSDGASPDATATASP